MDAASTSRANRMEAGVKRDHSIRYASAKKTATFMTKARTAPFTARRARHRARTYRMMPSRSDGGVDACRRKSSTGSLVAGSGRTRPTLRVGRVLLDPPPQNTPLSHVLDSQFEKS